MIDSKYDFWNGEVTLKRSITWQPLDPLPGTFDPIYYYRKASQGLEEVVRSAKTEKAVLEYLKLFPFLVPGVTDLGHGTYGAIVLNEFRFGAYRADFFHLSKDSQTVQATFVEIESPRKPVFTSSAEFTADFNQSLQQIRDWCQVFRNNANVVWYALGSYGEIPRQLIPTFKGYLVIGHRGEIQKNDCRQRRWASHAGSPHIKVMTFDHLVAAGAGSDWVGMLTCSIRGGLVTPLVPAQLQFVQKEHIERTWFDGAAVRCPRDESGPT